MATRKLRSKTVDSADEDVHVEVDCADNSSHSQSETLRGQQRGNSVVIQSEMQDCVVPGDNETQNNLAVKQ